MPTTLFVHPIREHEPARLGWVQQSEARWPGGFLWEQFKRHVIERRLNAGSSVDTLMRAINHSEGTERPKSASGARWRQSDLRKMLGDNVAAARGEFGHALLATAVTLVIA
jgi:hypothetical protein